MFSALVFLKSAIKEADGVHWGYWGFAAIKAILVAKFMLIGRALHIGEGLRDRPLIWQTLYKAIAFTIFVAILSVIEDAAIGMGVHGKTFSQSIADLGGGTVKEMIATELSCFSCSFRCSPSALCRRRWKTRRWCARSSWRG